VEELLRSKARIFIAQGTADKSGRTVAGLDALFTTLLTRGRPVTARLIPGADHGFRIADQPDRDGWKDISEAIRD
jgi:hypothetical protein